MTRRINKVYDNMFWQMDRPNPETAVRRASTRLAMTVGYQRESDPAVDRARKMLGVR